MNRDWFTVQALDVARVFPGHHRRHIDPAIIGEIAAALDALERVGKLAQGSGVFRFDSFSIHI